ncbi:substrate-binding domain-containing protein [Roseobacteraceae bacterium S113]
MAPKHAPLRIGALSTLSRNFQLRFLHPALDRNETDITLRSGNAQTLLAGLRDLHLDVVLSTEPPRTSAGADFIAHRLAEQPVAIHGQPGRLQHKTLHALMRSEAFILPTETSIRAGFLALAERLELTPRIAADVDDMAMVRLLARAGAGLAVAPAVVVADELAAGRLATAPFDLNIVESFYAITLRRSFPHPLLAELLSAASQTP